jgi:hypothetical protein
MADENKCLVCKTGDIKEEWGMCPTCKAEETLTKYYQLRVYVRAIVKEMWGWLNWCRNGQGAQVVLPPLFQKLKDAVDEKKQ